VVLVDGLVASAAAAVLVPESARLRLVILVHMPFGGVDGVDERDEATVLAAARAVVTTSAWTRTHLLARYRLGADRVAVARPGAEPLPVTPGSADGGGLLCVGVLAPHKGQDVLLEALTGVAGPWRCRVVGPADRDPAFAARLERCAVAAGLAGRVRFPGPRTGADLVREYRDADLLVVPSRAETYGMVVAEALAAGLPVVASAVGGVPEALGPTAAGAPGVLVPPGDVPALAGALSAWLADPGLRDRLRRAARRRRASLEGWGETAGRIGAVLAAVAAEPDPALRA
jgi:glycosyltransferase involved in cell wall biosynthesis